MANPIEVEEKYERRGWPALARPDLKPPRGWNLSLLTAVSRIRNHNLSPDGTQIAFIWDRDDLSDVYLMPTAGGWPKRITTNRGPVTYWDDETPQWSPNGQWLAFTINGHVYLANADSGHLQKITDFTSSAWSPVWLHDGRLVVSTRRGKTTQLLLTDVEGSWPQPLVTDPNGDAWDAQPAPNGRYLAFTFRPHNDLDRLDLRLVELATGQVHALTGTPQQKDWYARWSPDSQTLAFLSQRSGFNEVWLIRPDGQGLRQLTRLGCDVGELAWSPDGRFLACTINRQGALDLALVAVDSGEVTDLYRALGYHAHPSWSPQGDFLTIEYEDACLPPDLYRISVPDGFRTQLTFSMLPALAANNLIVPERISYSSYDDLEIPAFLYRPSQPNGAAIVHPHGGPSAQYTFGWDIFTQYLVAKGYTFLAPNYRGSTGYGIAFERANYNDWGQGDTQDCLHGADFLAGLAEVDARRIAIYGPSYGGYMVACCLARDPQYRFACGVSRYGDAHVLSSWAQCNLDLRLYTEIFLGHPAQNWEAYLAASPIYQIEKVQKPVLILHGLLDDVVPPQASEEWVMALDRAGKTYEYKTYAGEPHGFLKRASQEDAYARTERFLDWYLLPTGL